MSTGVPPLDLTEQSMLDQAANTTAAITKGSPRLTISRMTASELAIGAIAAPTSRCLNRAAAGPWDRATKWSGNLSAF